MSKHQKYPRPEVPPPPSAVLPTSLPPPLVVPPRRLMWTVSMMTGRAIAHAVVIGAGRTACRQFAVGEGVVPAPDGVQRCHECARVVGAQGTPEPGSTPNLSGE
jgi:hypothetical protein